MADQIKITVIATGFQRDTLPEIGRRRPHFPFTSASVPAMPAPGPVQAGPEPAVAATRQPEPEPVVEEAPPMDDYEMPAILRKQRRMVQ